MKNLFDPRDLEALSTRIAQLRPDSASPMGLDDWLRRHSPHCTLGVQTATGELRPPRKLSDESSVR